MTLSFVFLCTRAYIELERYLLMREQTYSVTGFNGRNLNHEMLPRDGLMLNDMTDY